MAIGVNKTSVNCNQVIRESILTGNWAIAMFMQFFIN